MMEKYNWKGKTILVVDDDQNSCSIITAILKKTQAKSVIATDGLQAVNICRLYEEIDLVLMDIDLPALNGIDVTKHILLFKPHLPIIAITAHDLKTECLAVGCVDFLSKPIYSEELLPLINKSLN